MAEESCFYRCPVQTCGYVYDEKRGDKKSKVDKGTKFEELPEEWKCPLCGCARERFEKS